MFHGFKRKVLVNEYLCASVCVFCVCLSPCPVLCPRGHFGTPSVPVARVSAARTCGYSWVSGVVTHGMEPSSPTLLQTCAYIPNPQPCPSPSMTMGVSVMVDAPLSLVQSQLDPTDHVAVCIRSRGETMLVTTKERTPYVLKNVDFHQWFVRNLVRGGPRSFGLESPGPSPGPTTYPRNPTPRGPPQSGDRSGQRIVNPRGPLVPESTSRQVPHQTVVCSSGLSRPLYVRTENPIGPGSRQLFGSDRNTIPLTRSFPGNPAPRVISTDGNRVDEWTSE